MDHKQLRIGNIINVWHEPSSRWKEIKVSDGSVIDFIGNQDDEESRGVTLTDIWLEKFGFTVGHNWNGMKYWGKDDLRGSVQIFAPQKGVYQNHETEPIEFVHQLQNYYHATFYEEL